MYECAVYSIYLLKEKKKIENTHIYPDNTFIRA